MSEVLKFSIGIFLIICPGSLICKWLMNIKGISNQTPPDEGISVKLWMHGFPTAVEELVRY